MAQTHDVVIVGSGFSGLCVATLLKRAKIDDFVVLERAAEIGGTWRDNQYPGAASDVPGHLYSLSVFQDGAWSRTFPGSNELLAYTHRLAASMNLLPHIRLRTELRRGTFNEDAAVWDLETSEGLLRARVLISAVGPLSCPRLPTIPGLETFRGRVFHSANWDHTYDLAGKNVAVIGTGASAAQLVPQIAQQVARLYVVQRTPAWVVPRGDSEIGPRFRALLQHSAPVRSFYRGLLYLQHESRLLAFAKLPWLMKFLERRATAHLRRQIPHNAWLREKLTPNYRLGCKRVVLSDDFYPTFNRPNVELLPEALQAVTPTGIVTNSWTRPADAIIFATGFDVGGMGGMDLRGRGGRRLDSLAQQGIEAYKGVAIADFPNLFLLGGPNTGVGHTSILYMVESAARYVVEAIKAMRRQGIAELCVKHTILRRYNDDLQQRLLGTVWQTGCSSWYLHPRTGRNLTIWPSFSFLYRWALRRFDLGAYESRRLSDISTATPQSTD